MLHRLYRFVSFKLNKGKRHAEEKKKTHIHARTVTTREESTVRKGKRKGGDARDRKRIVALRLYTSPSNQASTSSTPRQEPSREWNEARARERKRKKEREREKKP